MKPPKIIIALLLTLGLATGRLTAQTAADNDVTQGRAALAAQDLVTAYADFSAAVAASPTNETANTLLAITRVLVLPQQPAGSNFLTGLGVSASGRNLYDWTAMLPQDANGKTIDPSENSSVAVAFYQSTIIPALSASAANLARITDPNFTLTLTTAETDGTNVTVDYGDILLMQAEADAGEFLGYTLNAQNFDVVARTLQMQGESGTLSMQQLLADYPSLLTPNSGAALASSKAALTNAINFYQQASAFIRNVRPPGQGLFQLSEDQLATEAKFRTDLTNILLSLNGPVQITPRQPFQLDLGDYFSGAKSLRSLAPQFNSNNYVNNSLPDYAFGGILQNEPAYITEGYLRQHVEKGNNSGIYYGSVSDNYYYGGSGTNFAAFVSPSQQATIIGFDPNIMYPVFLQFKLDKDGNGQVTNGFLEAYATFYDGSCNAQIYYTNGVAFFLNGSGQPALGAFQSSAGYYSGTIGGGQNGNGGDPYLKAILGPDGGIFYSPTTTSGEPGDAGVGQFGVNNQFASTSISGTMVAGTLNPGKLVINGRYANGGGSGTWVISRSASVPFDVPPVISVPPANVTNAAGTTATFRATASGSAPLSYQWYEDGLAINGATAATLVVTNVPGSANGSQYTVTVNNVAGGTAATAVLTVADTSTLTLTEANLKTGQQVSNGVFTVNGTASDVVGVAAVWYQLNNGPWTEAVTTNHWTNWLATLPLNPGPNTLRTYAQDADSDGYLYVADYTNNLIRRVTRGGLVTTVAGDTYDLTNGAGNAGYADGTGTAAKFNGPNFTVVDAGGNIFVADSGNNLIRKITPAGVVSTVAGDTFDLTNNASNAGYADGTGTAAKFNYPTGIAVDSAGNLYVADLYNNLIREITPAGVVSTLAGDTYDLTNAVNNFGYVDGTGTAAQFYNPAGLAVDGNGNVYVADQGNNLVREISPAGVVTTLAGDTYDLTIGAGNAGYADGTGSQAQFSDPTSVAVDGAGNVFVADYVNNLIREITPGAVVATLAGDTYDLTNGFGNAGYADGIASSARFNQPSGVGVDAYDNVFVAEYGNNLLREITPAGAVFTLAGDTYDLTNITSGIPNAGYADGVGGAAKFNGAAGVAVDGSGGKVSPTNTVVVTFVESAVLTVQTNVHGWGAISPNENGALIQINSTNTLTAIPAKGFGLKNWTDGNGNVLTNGAVLKFVMSPNLTLVANFADTTPPKVAITNVPAGLAVSNASFVVKGTASDNVAVSNVEYSLNGAGWLPVNSTNQWSNWTVGVTLVPGANSILAQAVDTSGNVSTVASNSVKYVLSAVLTVRTNPPGWGTISPSYNGAALQIGSPYTLMATAATGFGFKNWTDGSGNVRTNGATLKFTMSSNLTLVANFADTTPPKVAITNVPAGLAVSNASFVVKGTASDNVAVSNVEYSLNGAGWLPVNSTNQWSNWTVGVTLVPGANSILAQAVDTSGNVSTVASNSVKYVLSAVLTVRTNLPGWGTISPSYNGAALQIGSPYTLTATAATGFGFKNWTDGSGNLRTNGVTLKFVMSSNLTLVANFADTTSPKVAITNVPAGLVVSNDTFVVKGTAGDNAALSNVWYQVNSNAWQTIGNGNTLSNWMAEVPLSPGSNTIRAQAEDTSGNYSTVATKSLVFNFALGGTWNVVQQQTPAYMTWDAVNGLVGGQNFYATNGTLTFSPDGSLAGVLVAPFTGEYGAISNGLLTTVFYTADGTNVYNLAINASQDTMGEVDATSDWHELLVLTRAPATSTLASLAGFWNVFELKTPNVMSVDGAGALVNGSSFFATNGSLTVGSSGSFSGTLDGPLKGSVAPGSNGLVAVTTIANGQTNTDNFSVNAGQNLLVSGTITGSHGVLLMLVRAPASVANTDVAGVWNAVNFTTPAKMTLDTTNGLQGGDNFVIHSGSLTLDAKGNVSGNVGGPFSGTYSVGSDGVVNFTTTNDSGTPQTSQVWLNATKDVLITVQTKVDGGHNQQEINIFQRASN